MTIKGSAKSRSVLETVMQLIFLCCGLAAVLAVIAISVYMVIAGGPAIMKVGIGKFLFGVIWQPTAQDPQFGILPMILSSIVGTFGAILLGVPIGLLTAVFMSQVAPKGLVSIVRPAVELLAGIPSVVYGLIGMMVIVPAIGKISCIGRYDAFCHYCVGNHDSADHYQRQRDCAGQRAGGIARGIAGVRCNTDTDDFQGHHTGGTFRHRHRHHFGRRPCDRGNNGDYYGMRQCGKYAEFI